MLIKYARTSLDINRTDLITRKGPSLYVYQRWQYTILCVTSIYIGFIMAHKLRNKSLYMYTLYLNRVKKILGSNKQHPVSAPGSSVGSDASCQSMCCEFETQLGQHSFRCLTKVNTTLVIRLPPMG